MIAASPTTPSRAEGRLDPRVRHLVLTHHWFDEVASGRKRIEYRAMTHRWARLLVCVPPPREVVFHRGYTQTTMRFAVDKIDIGPCPYANWPGDWYRIHLGIQLPNPEAMPPSNGGRKA